MLTAPATPPGPAAAALDGRLLDVSVGEIATFLALVDRGGFTAAARGLHLSQPGVSARVRRLERALGVVLVDRSVRRLTLTPEGEAFLPQAREVARALEAGHREARAAAHRSWASL